MRISRSQIQDETAFLDALEKRRQASVAHMMSGETGPNPPADPFLDQFIKRTPTGPNTPDEFSIDCEIVDDPQPEPMPVSPLDELRAQEMAELAALIPPNKARLMQMEVNRAYAVPEKDRTPAQQKTISDAIERQKKAEEIQYAYALREAELGET